MYTRWSDFEQLFGWPDNRRTWSALESFRRQMDQLFQEWESPSAYAVSVWPRTNLYDAGNELIVTAEVPGMTGKDVEVTVHQNVMSLTGKREQVIPEGYSVHRQERGPIEFKRTFSLPCKVDSEKTNAVVKDGILTIRMAKAPESQPRQITVQAQ